MAKNIKYFTTKERNEWFAKLSPAKQRVQIAKDVLTQLDIQKFKATSGTYFLLVDVSDKYDNGNKEMQEVIENSGTCSVCAKGAIFAAKVLNYNNCALDMADNYDCGRILVSESNMSSNLSDIFSKKQLDLIENAFECDYINEVWPHKDDLSHALNLCCARYMLSDDDSGDYRMRQIMHNIIDNKGTFVVKKYKDFDVETQGLIEFYISHLN